MGTLMLIGLTTFQIGDQVMVSYFFLEIVLLVKVIKKPIIALSNTKVQYISVVMVVVKWFGYENYF